ncbi:hypothetical protein ACFVKH_03950 [Almyronema epifaneia S1]|uniref:Sulfotransferase domain-containing protein n=1 Tax=Almyronema epifaneia S1 TaxID=2991925 RepID=A0ABW6IBK8_9CYAN
MRLRSHRWLSQIFKLSTRQHPVTTNKLVYLFGLKRSGLHALSFWLLGHCTSNMLVNNSPAKRRGNASRMMRTIRTSPLPTIINQGDQIATYRNQHEYFEPLPAAVDLSVVLFQSQSLPYLAAQPALTDGIIATTSYQVLLLRDPFNWAASYLHKSQHPEAYLIWPDLWREYVNEFVGNTHYLGDTVKVNYNCWFTDASYRQQISAQLGLTFTDEALEVVTAHAGGSSFDQTQFNASAQQMSVMNRWQHYQHEPQYREAFQKNQDILNLGMQLFDLPPDLQTFAQQCRAA